MAVFSVLLIACGDDGGVGAEDAGSSMDAAPPPVDASGLDGGSPDDGGPADAGSSDDAGPSDAGSSDDAGAPDAGSSDDDAGVSGDAGPSDAAVEVDAGADVCASVDCSSLDDACRTGTCDPAGGTCFAQPTADDTACDDGESQTSGDVCYAGVCEGVPGDTAGEDTICRYAARHPGFLDRFQDASDGSVLFCHKDGLGVYGFVNSSFSSCLTHWDNHRAEEVIGGLLVQTGDVFPTLGCGA